MLYRQTELPNAGRQPRIFNNQGPGAVEEAGGEQSLQPVPVEGGEVGQQLGQVKLAREVGGHSAPGMAQAGPDEGGLSLVVLSLNQPLNPALGRIVKLDQILNSKYMHVIENSMNIEYLTHRFPRPHIFVLLKAYTKHQKVIFNQTI